MICIVGREFVGRFGGDDTTLVGHSTVQKNLGIRQENAFRSDHPWMSLFKRCGFTAPNSRRILLAWQDSCSPLDRQLSMNWATQSGRQVEVDKDASSNWSARLVLDGRRVLLGRVFPDNIQFVGGPVWDTDIPHRSEHAGVEYRSLVGGAI